MVVQRPPSRPRPPEVSPETPLVAAPFEDLLTEVLDRVSLARDEQARWRLLLDAVVTMAAGLSLDDLLARIVRIGSDIVGARYVALGVLASGGERRLRMFVTHGLSEEQIAQIGDLPGGHGILGLIIDRPEPLRLHDLAAHAQSYGFPAEHPPMHSFLGVPVRTGDKIFGNLYLAEKVGGGDFSVRDEEIVVALAAAAGVAIENALLHEEASRRERWLDARAEITADMMADTDRIAALQLVADRAREIAEADLAWIATGPEPDMLRLEVVSGVAVERGILDRTPLTLSLASTAVRSAAPLVVEDLASQPESVIESVGIDVSAIGPTVIVPLGHGNASGDADAVGVLALGWFHKNAELARDLDVAVTKTFAEQIAIAIRLARSREDREQLAMYDDRDRIGRDLHDVVIQRLFAIGLRLQGSLRWADSSPLRARLDEAVDEIDRTIKDIRRSIFELSVPDQAGDVQSQVTEVVARAASALKFRPSLSFEGPVRLRVPPVVAYDLVAALGEALSNISRHAQATTVSVEVEASDRVVLRVRDNGRGIPDDAVESGMVNMRHRAEKHGGTSTVVSPETGGTVVEWSVPLA
jgi:signal transduction histidine kinase